MPPRRVAADRRGADVFFRLLVFFAIPGLLAGQCDDLIKIWLAGYEDAAPASLRTPDSNRKARQLAAPPAKSAPGIFY